MPATPIQEVPLTRAQRLVTGLLLLLAVDLIWVASSEFTEYIFHDLSFNKPFFSTYFKTSLFMIYLVGFITYRTWRDQCWSELRSSSSSNRYERVRGGSSFEDESDDEHRSHDGASSSGNEDQSPAPSTSGQRFSRSLSSPSWVPANIPDSGKSSGTDSDSEAMVNARRVRFSKEAQVVEMNPAEALYANLARLSYAASMRAHAALRRAASRLTIKEVALLALTFCFPWFLGNYFYQLALSNTEAAIVNVLSSSSCLFTLILSAIFPSDSGDKFSLSKLVAVAFNTIGVFFVCYSDIDLEDGLPLGAFWTLGGAFFYATYLVVLKKKVNNEENMDTPMFFGFVGFFNTLILWPFLAILHFSGAEPFQLPSAKQWQFLAINGIIGTVLSELLWLWGCFYTSSLVATLAISLTIPMTILADIVWREKRYSLAFFVGAIPMFISFFLVAMLTHYQEWDPITDCLRYLWNKCKRILCPSSASGQVYISNTQDVGEEGESLINQESSHEDA